MTSGWPLTPGGITLKVCPQTLGARPLPPCQLSARYLKARSWRTCKAKKIIGQGWIFLLASHFTRRLCLVFILPFRIHIATNRFRWIWWIQISLSWLLSLFSESNHTNIFANSFNEMLQISLSPFSYSLKPNWLHWNHTLHCIVLQWTV